MSMVRMCQIILMQSIENCYCFNVGGCKNATGAVIYFATLKLSRGEIFVANFIPPCE